MSRKSLKEHKQEFIEEGMEVVYGFIEVAKGNGTLKTSDKKIADKVFDAMVPMLQAESDAKKIDANNTADVIKLLSSGKISITDAKDLMQMLSVRSDIEDIKTLLSKVNQLTGDGRTIDG